MAGPQYLTQEGALRADIRRDMGPQDQDGAVEVGRPREVPHAISDLGEAVVKLGFAVDSIEGRLQPLLVDADPTDVVVYPEYETGLAQGIGSVTVQVARLAARLAELEQRVQL